LTSPPAVAENPRRNGNLPGHRFTLTSGQLTASIGPAQERNRAFAAAGGRQGAVVFPNLRLFVITCLDPRVDPAHFLGLELSDAIVVRNVGGRVTPEVINDVAFIGQESTLRERAVLDPAATVAADVERLRAAPAVSPRVRVSGHVYDVVTGLVETVVPAGR
jgi:carbonic anhydrase